MNNQIKRFYSTTINCPCCGKYLETRSSGHMFYGEDSLYCLGVWLRYNEVAQRWWERFLSWLTKQTGHEFYSKNTIVHPRQWLGYDKYETLQNKEEKSE